MITGDDNGSAWERADGALRSCTRVKAAAISHAKAAS